MTPSVLGHLLKKKQVQKLSHQCRTPYVLLKLYVVGLLHEHIAWMDIAIIKLRTLVTIWLFGLQTNTVHRLRERERVSWNSAEASIQCSLCAVPLPWDQ